VTVAKWQFSIPMIPSPFISWQPTEIRSFPIFCVCLYVYFTNIFYSIDCITLLILFILMFRLFQIGWGPFRVASTSLWHVPIF
jgi:hypothetical protein